MELYLEPININKRALNGQFLPGHIPKNKGQKGIHRSPETEFKKGNIPPQTKYDGAISLRKKKDKQGNVIEQYYYIRIAKGKWELLHRYNYKKKYGDIPAGMILVSKDENPLNCDADNWECITKSHNMARNRNRKKAAESLKQRNKIKKLRERYGL